MQTYSEEHVVDGGGIPCSWKGRIVDISECAQCGVFEGTRTRDNGGRPIEFVRCSPPIPLL